MLKHNKKKTNDEHENNNHVLQVDTADSQAFQVNFQYFFPFISTILSVKGEWVEWVEWEEWEEWEEWAVELI